MDPEQKSIERLKAASEMSLHAYGLPLVVTTSSAKAADVAPVRHGKWEKYKATVNLGYLRCSVCEDVYIDEDWLEDGRWNYCPNCGAKMDGGGENATD